jgi:hypothetical protein
MDNYETNTILGSFYCIADEREGGRTVTIIIGQNYDDDLNIKIMGSASE